MAATALPATARILVIVIGRIGDTLLATPVLRAAKEACPEGRLTVLAHPARAEVLQHLPFVDRLGRIDKLRARFLGWFGGVQHDAALVFGRDRALVDYALRVARTVAAYDEPGFPRSERLALVPPETGTHAVAERFRLAAALGIRANDHRLAYTVTEAERAAARALVERRWPGERGPLVALQTASFPTKPHRDWPMENFVELAARLRAERPETRFMILGDVRGRAAARLFMMRHGERTLLAAGSTRLRESAALIALADLYVGVDTGPTHIAGALGVPMVALYHCDYPGRNLAPIGHPRCAVIEHPGKPGTGATMAAITVDEVHRAARALLAG